MNRKADANAHCNIEALDDVRGDVDVSRNARCSASAARGGRRRAQRHVLNALVVPGTRHTRVVQCADLELLHVRFIAIDY